MSQIEHNIRDFLAKKPEIERCLQQGLINRRSLARFLIKNQIAKEHQLEAVIATLRRYQFKTFSKEQKDLFKNTKVRLKDNICLLDFEKDKNLLKALKNIIDETDYDQGETLKIVVGTSTISVFLDEENKDVIKTLTKQYNLRKKTTNVSEISILFSERAIETKGVFSQVTTQLYLHEITISEILTANSEMIMYIPEEEVLKAYELVKGMKS